MLKIALSNCFKKDLKLAARRGYNLDLLDQVVETLARGEPLPEKNRDHLLSGDYAGFRECHIQPDWRLVYRIDEGALFLFWSCTGIHSDLFS